MPNNTFDDLETEMALLLAQGDPAYKLANDRKLPMQVKRSLKLVSFITTLKKDELTDDEFSRLDELLSQNYDLAEYRRETESALAFFRAFENDNKIEAIKSVRAAMGSGLKESKDFVEYVWPTFQTGIRRFLKGLEIS